MTSPADGPTSKGDDKIASHLAELDRFLRSEWSPDLTVGEWWERLGSEGWAAPAWPAAWFGRDLGGADARDIAATIRRFGALGGPGGIGMMLAGPTILAHGDDDQKKTYLRDIVTGRTAWCQLFSEPGAGSDLAGLSCQARGDGDEWVVNGQKVWTSGGQLADYGMLIARTNPSAPKHRGISWFAFDMRQDGVEVRPLREITGRAMFNEVFLTNARALDSQIVGGLDNGWAVTNTTLALERAGLGAGSSTATRAQPGQAAGHLDRRAGDLTASRSDGGGDPVHQLGGLFDLLLQTAARSGSDRDPTIRQELARVYALRRVGELNQQRLKASRAVGGDIPGLPNIAKLLMSELVRAQRDVGLRILGPLGTLHAYSAESRAALDTAIGHEGVGAITEMALFAQAPPIYGGTDQIQRNILGERVLGLPRDSNATSSSQPPGS